MKEGLSLMLALILVQACLSSLTFAATINLLEDVNDKTGENTISSDNSFTLDLNGHKLQSTGIAVFVFNKATGVTVITDSVGGGSIVSEKTNLNIRGGGLQGKGETYAGLKEYTTPETATVDLATVIPGEAPAVQPETPAEDKKDDTKQPAAPVSSEVNSGAPVGLIIGIVAAVVVIAAVVLVVLKKKKN